MNNISVKVRLLGYLADELGQELSITSEANSLQGLKDLLELKHPFLKNKKYNRIRIGIGRPSEKKSVANYVLSALTSEEEIQIHQILNFFITNI